MKIKKHTISLPTHNYQKVNVEKTVQDLVNQHNAFSTTTVSRLQDVELHVERMVYYIEELKKNILSSQNENKNLRFIISKQQIQNNTCISFLGNKEPLLYETITNNYEKELHITSEGKLTGRTEVSYYN